MSSKLLFSRLYNVAVMASRDLCQMDASFASGMTAKQMANIQRLLQDVASGKNPFSLEVKTKQLCAAYTLLDDEARHELIKYIACSYGANQENVEGATQTFMSCQVRGDPFRLRAMEKLRFALIPQYMKLFHSIGRLESGIKFLVDLRTTVMNLLLETNSEDIEFHHMRIMNAHLQELLGLWFSIGLLKLERITWESSCDMLQKISEYEAVHPVRNWTDLKRRVGSYRRCFAFIHSSMPKEPIVVLHVFLTDTISSSIQQIVAPQRLHSAGDITSPILHSQEEDPRKILAAVFYSISATQKGLQGIDLGTQLILRVVREIQMEFPNVWQFSSLSPIPGFRDWLMSEIISVEKGESPACNVLNGQEFSILGSYLCSGEGEKLSVWSRLCQLLKNNGWIQDEKLVDMLRAPFMKLCARYLYKEKRRGYALNSVAHFHLRNGAVMWRLNWRADLSPRGLTNSCGMMINYRYYLKDAEENSQKYIDEQKISASEEFLHLLDLPRHEVQQHLA